VKCSVLLFVKLRRIINFKHIYFRSTYDFAFTNLLKNEVELCYIFEQFPTIVFHFCPPPTTPTPYIKHIKQDLRLNFSRFEVLVFEIDDFPQKGRSESVTPNVNQSLFYFGTNLRTSEFTHWFRTAGIEELVMDHLKIWFYVMKFCDPGWEFTKFFRQICNIFCNLGP
jgi:hypothetical protein